MWCVSVCNSMNTGVLDGLLYKGQFLWSANTKEHDERAVYSSCKQHHGAQWHCKSAETCKSGSSQLRASLDLSSPCCHHLQVIYMVRTDSLLLQ